MSPRLGFFLSAVLGILSFPPIGLWPLAYVAMVPFLLSCRSAAPRRALLWGFLSGLVFFAGVLYWVGLNSGAPPLLSAFSAFMLVLLFSSIWAFTAWAVSHVARRLSVVWTAAFFVSVYIFWEVFWGTGELGFPWAIWGLTQIGFLPAAQLADLADNFGLSFWVLALNAIAFVWWTRRARRDAVVFAVVLIVPVLYGFVRLQQIGGGMPVPVAAVQANTAADEKWEIPAEDIAQSYLTTSLPLAGTGTRLVVWPETATPTALRFRPWLRTALQRFADSTGMSLLTGATDYTLDPVRGQLPHNSAFLIRPGERDLLSSAKIHLVPFGERIPFQSVFPFLSKLHLGQAEWVPGKAAVVFPQQNGVPPFGCLICYEVVFPEIAADMVRQGALILTTITNDGWYGNSSGPYQHLALARLRAIATRRSIVRSANTGISALILPTGAVQTRLAYNRAGQISGTVPARGDITLAVRLARVWWPFSSLLLLLMVSLVVVKARRLKAAPPAP